MRLLRELSSRVAVSYLASRDQCWPMQSTQYSTTLHSRPDQTRPDCSRAGQQKMRRQCKAANAENDVANVEMLTRRSATTIKISGEPKRTPTKRERERRREGQHHRSRKRNICTVASEKKKKLFICNSFFFFVNYNAILCHTKVVPCTIGH